MLLRRRGGEAGSRSIGCPHPLSLRIEELSHRGVEQPPGQVLWEADQSALDEHVGDQLCERAKFEFGHVASPSTDASASTKSSSRSALVSTSVALQAARRNAFARSRRSAGVSISRSIVTRRFRQRSIGCRRAALTGPRAGTSALADLRSVCTACEHMFVTSDGSPYARLRRAIEARNIAIINATAAELPYIGLRDALGIAGGGQALHPYRWTCPAESTKTSRQDEGELGLQPGPACSRAARRTLVSREKSPWQHGHQVSILWMSSNVNVTVS
jgi:hypothetical protein